MEHGDDQESAGFHTVIDRIKEPVNERLPHIEINGGMKLRHRFNPGGDFGDSVGEILPPTTSLPFLPIIPHAAISEAFSNR